MTHRLNDDPAQTPADVRSFAVADLLGMTIGEMAEHETVLGTIAAPPERRSAAVGAVERLAEETVLLCRLYRSTSTSAT